MLDRETGLRLGAGAPDVNRARRRIRRQPGGDAADTIERIGVLLARQVFEGGDARSGEDRAETGADRARGLWP